LIHQGSGGEIADDGSFPMTRLDQTHGFERQDRFAERAAADVQLFRQFAFGREFVAGAKQTVTYNVLNLLYHLLVEFGSGNCFEFRFGLKHPQTSMTGWSDD
jgi:hypothetical protein